MALLDDVSSVVDVPQPKHKGRCSVGDLRQLILWGIRHNVTWNAQALGFNSQGPPSTPPFLSCPAIEGESGDPRPPPRPSRPRPALSPRRAPKQKHPPSSTPVPRRSRLLKPQSEAVEVGHSHLREMGYFASAEILEAACNSSIPGLTGVSNFTVFLYCNLFDGDDGSVDPEVGQVGPDLHATCSDAAWYLSAAEDDFLWVHVCSEFFAHQFNNTVCANSSFWLQRAHQAAEMKDYHYFNQSSIGDLCVQLSGEVVEGGGSPGPDEACLAQLGTRSLSAQDFRRCFLPNTSALVSALCGSESPEAHPSHPSIPEGSWAAEYCSRLHNSSHPESIEDTCDYRKWSLQHFTNATLLELCVSTEGLREYVCSNATLYRRLLPAYPNFSDLCVDLDVEQEDRKCFLQWFFDMLPAPYDFDTSQLCVSPAPLLVEALHRLSVCEVDGGERGGWVGAVGYVLRVL
uniref:Uncharacterized protein n=2 Tax=Salmo trutta TaxID=8032 RepID=A0A673ZEU8_SALTR